MTPDVNVLVAHLVVHPHHKPHFLSLSAAITACAEGVNLQLMSTVVAFFAFSHSPQNFRRADAIEDAFAFS